MAKRRRRQKRRVPRIDLAGLGPLLRRASLAAVGLVAPVVVLWGLVTLLDRPVRGVTVQGPFERVSVMQLEAAVGDLRGVGFLSVDLDAVRRRVLAVEWVDEAVVRRRWPASVEVIVSEQVPAARWGESGLLNVRGELFVRDARHVPPELPRLSGPEGTEATVARHYLDARAVLAAAGFNVRSLAWDARGSWRIELSNGVQVRLGRDSFDERLRRFARVAGPLVTDRPGQVEYVDLRYSRGFAIGWAGDGYNERTPMEGKKTDV